MFFESTTYLIENQNKGNVKWFWSSVQNPNYFETSLHLIFNPLEILYGIYGSEIHFGAKSTPANSTDL